MAMEKQFQELTLKQKKLKIQFPRRPGLGTLGKKVLVRANYVKLVKFPNSKLFRYNFDVLTSAGRKPSRTVRGKILLEMIKQKKFGDCIPIYDWNDLIYCSKELPIGKGNGTKLEFILPPNEEDGHKKPTKFTVTIKSGREINLQVLNNYITLGTRPEDNDDDDDDDVQTCMSALNAFLSYKVRTSFLSVGRGVYPSVSDDRRIILNTGEELRKGFRQSLRIGWDNLLVNVDTSSAILFPPGNILDVIAGFFGCHRNDLKDGIKEEDRKFLHKILKGVKVYVTHRGSEKKRKFTIDGLSSEPANRLKFKNQEDREMTISEYFKETYKPLEFGKLPCIIFKQKCYLPLEVCVLLPDQPYKGNLSEDARAEMIKHTCVKPVERFRTIDDSFRNFFQYDQNEHLKSIGMNIDINTKVKAESRILPPPSLTFHKDSKLPTHVVEGGRWNYVNRKILEGQTLVNWSVLVLSNDNQEAVEGFMRTFREILNTKGMNIVNNPQIMKFSAQRNIKEGLVQAVQKAQINKQAPPQLVVVVMRERSPIYNDIKRIGETDLGVRTQCMLSRHLRKRQEQYCVNLGLKINAKLGGKNFSLSPGQIDFISSVPTMVFGADVFHSGRTEQQVPSIAAVCASMDPAATVYSGRHSVNQKPRNETIENLEGMVVDLLKAFQNRNKRLPQRILFYRDGVSEGQFKKVIVEEVEAMRRAFKRGYGDKPPKLTFVIVQKRHNTRLVPDVPRDADRNGNCKSGTVIDTVIVSKHEFDFFLQSHASLQGTARSAHYRVLVDENGFNADSMQSLTNKLCYLNARCTSAISIVTPAFYAHLIANRARIYLTWDGKSSSEGGTYSCPDVKKGMENIMYFI